MIEGEPAIPVAIKLDNVIGPRDAPWLIVDAKYKNPLIEHHGDRFRNSDLYQAFTYASALNAPAVLVYPRVDQHIDVVLEMGGGRSVGAVSADLKCAPSQGGLAVCLASLHAVQFSHVDQQR